MAGRQPHVPQLCDHKLVLGADSWRESVKTALGDVLACATSMDLEASCSTTEAALQEAVYVRCPEGQVRGGGTRLRVARAEGRRGWGVTADGSVGGDGHTTLQMY